MARKHPSRKARAVPKTVLRLPDLDQAKSAVLNSLSSHDAQRGYRNAIDEFIEWYCSEPKVHTIPEDDGPAEGQPRNSESWHPERSTCASGPCGVSPMKPPIAVSSALILLPVFGE